MGDTATCFVGSNHQINLPMFSVDDYVYAISGSNLPQRYSVANNNWQSGANLSFNTSDGKDQLSNVAAVVLKSKIYVIHGYERDERDKRAKWVDKSAVVHCFDPVKNEWEQKASTCHPHFGSSLCVVNDRLCVAGGNISCNSSNGNPCGKCAPVEVYDEENNTWSVVEQKHIPSNNLGAVEIEGRVLKQTHPANVSGALFPSGHVEVYDEENNQWCSVPQPHMPPNNYGAVEIEGRIYFILGSFAHDSGIRISDDGVYHVDIEDWEPICHHDADAGFVYMPVNRNEIDEFKQMSTKV
ncbi:hypothetical protein OS493_021170 [Desmophyllum pertusum]|uniref:Uncharacterized protein n=1 Tax=Desmophyllum pertusum TaxID=174260 RepID=A0A9X0D4H7_9CNID|nr:hypothetical protein OS493_021170 [Desmophyllum pertusum]